jgi:two-component system, cell cycle sensor histidine kinase PleC
MQKASPPIESPSAVPEEGRSASADACPELGQLAHELRTPLSAIAVLAEIMRDERLGPLPDPRYRGYAADIHETASHGLAVIASWLDPSAGAGAAATLARTRLDVNSLVAGCASALEPLALEAGVRLSCRLSPATPEIAADPRSLKQVLLNLLTNAFASTPPGGSVTLTTGAPPGRVAIAVEDSGDGMTTDELARVRALSTQEAQVQAARPGGTGYGLPLVFTLTSANGGTVEIESAPRRGTRVVLDFPAMASLSEGDGAAPR